ncbi:MAG: MarR family transcriptional regulator [Pseudomonadota bacterium]|nr:MarR family transcriptional regulator [Pseudomonadota bacterium]
MNLKPGALARRFQQHAVAAFHVEASAAGVDLTPVQYAVLAEVHARPSLDQATLAGHVALDRTTASGVVDRLAEKGLVTRRVSAADRRARALEVTPEGAALLQRIEPAVAAAQATILRGLERAEAEELVRLMRKVLRAADARA